MTDARWYAKWPNPRSRSRSCLLESHSRGVDCQSLTGLIFGLIRSGITTRLLVEGTLLPVYQLSSAGRQGQWLVAGVFILFDIGVDRAFKCILRTLFGAAFAWLFTNFVSHMTNYVASMPAHYVRSNLVSKSICKVSLVDSHDAVFCLQVKSTRQENFFVEFHSTCLES